jgi:Mn-dependent DtxR family transcriptional regulator
MNSKDLSSYGKLLLVVAKMEVDLDIATLTESERRILGAIGELSASSEKYVSSKDIRENILCKTLTDPTYYRALKHIQDLGYIKVKAGRKTGLYSLF